MASSNCVAHLRAPHLAATCLSRGRAQPRSCTGATGRPVFAPFCFAFSRPIRCCERASERERQGEALAGRRASRLDQSAPLGDAENNWRSQRSSGAGLAAPKVRRHSEGGAISAPAGASESPSVEAGGRAGGRGLKWARSMALKRLAGRASDQRERRKTGTARGLICVRPGGEFARAPPVWWA